MQVKLTLMNGENMKILMDISQNDNFTIWANTKWLLENSMRNNMNASDIIVKIMAIENYYGKNNYGMDMYNKMQKIRVANNKLIEYSYYESIEKTIIYNSSCGNDIHIMYGCGKIGF